MKKLTALFLFIFLLNTTSFGQSKEETISWLKEKLSGCLETTDGPYSYCYKNIKLFSINECEFIIKYDFVYSYQGKDVTLKWEYTIPVADIIIVADKGGIQNKNEVIKYSTNDRVGVNKTGHTNDVSNIAFRNCGSDIYTRLQKAFDHLATYCPKKKETF